MLMKIVKNFCIRTNELHIANGLRRYTRSSTSTVKNLQEGPGLKDFLTNTASNVGGRLDDMEPNDPVPYISNADISGQGRKGMHVQ